MSAEAPHSPDGKNPVRAQESPPPNEPDKSSAHSSAQEQHAHDDQKRAMQQDPGQHANLDKPPRPSKAKKRGTDQARGSNTPSDGNHDGDPNGVYEAVRRADEAIKSGAEAPA